MTQYWINAMNAAGTAGFVLSLVSGAMTICAFLGALMFDGSDWYDTEHKVCVKGLKFFSVLTAIGILMVIFCHA